MVETTEGVGLPLEVAGAGARGIAALIDLVLWGLGALAVLLTLLLAAGGDASGVAGFALGLVAGGLFLTLVLYHVAFALLWDGRTPGKAFLGLRVRDAHGHPPQASQVLLRSLFLLVEILPLPVPIGFAILAASPRGQRLGDAVAGTLVLRDPPALGRGPRAARAAVDAPPVTPAQAARLDARDRALLRAFLAREELRPAARRRLAGALARHYAARLGLEPPRGEEAARGLLEGLERALRARA